MDIPPKSERGIINNDKVCFRCLDGGYGNTGIQGFSGCPQGHTGVQGITGVKRRKK